MHVGQSLMALPHCSRCLCVPKAVIWITQVFTLEPLISDMYLNVKNNKNYGFQCAMQLT